MKRSLALVMVALSLQGCHVDKKDPRTAHQGPPPAIEDSSSTPTDRKSGYFGIDLNAVFARAQSADPANRINSVLVPLAAILLDQNKLSDPAFKGHSQTTWALIFFNMQLVTALQESRDNAALKAILTNYHNRILQDCDPGRLTGCRNLEFFKRDPQIVSVIKVLALQTENVESYYRLLAIAFELKSSVADPELQQMIYARMIDFLKIYVDVTTSGEVTRLALKPMNAQKREEFSFYSRFISSALRTSTDIHLTGAQSLELFNWLSSNQMEGVLGRDLTTVITDLLSAQLDQPEMWTQFVRMFSREQQADELSYSNALRRVQSADPRLFSRLGVTPYDLNAQIQSRSKDLAAVFFLSRIFDLKPVSRERYLWDLANIEASSAIDLMEAFVRVTMIDRALDTHRRMAEFYRNYQRDGRPQSELLFEAMKYADQNLTPKWKDYVTRVQQIEVFFANEIERRYEGERDTPRAQKIAKMRNFFEELNPSIKYLVTYPNMIMLGYFAAKMNMQFRVTTFFGATIEINKDLVLHDLMDGNLSPMFLFTSFRSAEARRNSQPIDSVQMLWSLYFAMVSDLPKLYDIPSHEFLGTFITAYKARTDQVMRGLIDTHEKLLRPNSDLQQLFRLCDAPEGSRRLFVNQIDLTAIKSSAFLGEFSDPRVPFKTAIRAVNLNAKDLKDSFDEAIETLRSDVDPILRRLLLIRAAVKLADSTDEVSLHEIDQLMAESMALRQRLLDSSRVLIEKIPECAMKIHRIEARRRRDVIHMEIDFLNQVQMVLQTMARAPNEQSGLETLKAQPFFAELDTTKPALRALNDLFIAKTHMNLAFNDISEYQSDHQRWGGFQKDSTGRIYFNHRSRDLLVRLAQFLMYGFNGKSIAPSLDTLQVTLPPTLRELEVRSKSTVSTTQDMQLYYRSRGSILMEGLDHFRAHVKWLGDHYGFAMVFRSFLRQLVALYKFDYLGDPDLEKHVNCDAACSASKLLRAKEGAIRLIEYCREILFELQWNNEDRELLRLFEVPSFYNFSRESHISGNGPKNLFINDNSAQDFIGLTDEVFTFLTSKRLGFRPLFWGLRPYAENAWIYEERDTMAMAGERARISAESLITRKDYYEASRKYYTTLRDKENLLLFHIDPDVDRQIDLFHTHAIRSDFVLANLFIDTAYNWVRENPLPITQFTSLIDGVTLPVLSNSLVGNYRALVLKYHEETSFVFDPSRN